MMRGAGVNLLFTIAAFAAAACSIFETRWHLAAAPMTPVWVQVSAEQLAAVCHEWETGLRNFACVKRHAPSATCFIFAAGPREAQSEDTIEHEEQKHCMEGLDHE